MTAAIQHKLRSQVAALSAFCCFVCIAAFALNICRQIAPRAFFDNNIALKKSAAIQACDTRSNDAYAPDVLGSISVDGTSVNTLVANAGLAPQHDWYLSHDANGKPSKEGCPYLDARCNPNGRHLLIFGHHIHGTSLGFSGIAEAYTVKAFDSLGDATLTLPNKSRMTFKPLCALKVKEGFEDIQCFRFPDIASLQLWLNHLCDLSCIKSESAQKQIEQATRVLTLVTCSNDRPQQPDRTLVIFSNR